MAYNKYLLSLITILSILLFINFGFSLDISGCMDLNEDYLNTTLYLTNDFNLDGLQTCFNLDFVDETAGQDTYFELNCNGYDLNSSYSNPYILKVFDSIDIITIKDCNTYNISIIYLENDTNKINILDSNISFTSSSSSEILYSNYYNNNLDLNFEGSILNGVYSGYSVFDFNIGINNLNVYNLDLNMLIGTNNLLTINNHLKNISIYDSNLKNFNSLFNLNNITDYLDLNINIYNSSFYRYSTNSWYQLVNILDSNLKNLYVTDFFDINSTDSKELFSIDSSFIDNIYIIDFNIQDYRTNLFGFNDINNSDINIYFVNSDFNLGTLFSIVDSYYFNITLNNVLNSNVRSYVYNYFGNINILNSDFGLVFDDYLGLFDVNIFGTNSNLTILDSRISSSFEESSVRLSDLNLIILDTVKFYSTNIFNLAITDCNLYVFAPFDFSGGAYDLNFYNTSIYPYYDAFFIIHGTDLNIYNLNLNSNFEQGVINLAYGYQSNKNIINIFDSNINISQALVYSSDTPGYSININNSDINYLLLNNTYISDLNESILDLNNINVNYIVLDSISIDSNNPIDSFIKFQNITDDFIDINFFNFYMQSAVNLYDVNNLFYFKDCNIDELNIYGFNNPFSDIPNNGLFLNDSNIFNFTLEDSVLYLDSVANIDENSFLNALIYNNIIYDYNLDNAFVFNQGTTNIDFNTTLQKLDSKRIIFDHMIYDYNSIGGNLWFDSLGNYLCIYDYNQDGICDNNKSILYSDLSYAYDYHPLVEHVFDLNVYNLSLSSNTEGLITVTCNFGNSGNLALNDYNLLFYVNDVLLDTKNITNELLPLDINSTTFSWNASKGTYNLSCSIYSQLNYTSLNNSYSKTVTITSDGGSDGDSKTYNVKLTSNYSGSLSSSTNTTITSNITKSGTKLAESLTYKIYALKGSEKILVYSKNISASEVTNGQTIDKEIKASDLSGNLLDYISNDKISFVIEIDSDDDVSKDNTETLNIPTNYFEVILNANIDSKLTSDINAKIIGKVSKLGNLNDVILNLYLISENNKKLIDQKTIESYPYDYNYFLNINTITENLDYIDSQGYINLKLELESNDTNAENNSKNLRSKVEFFDFDIENILLNDNNYELNDTFEFNILETYNLVYVLNYSSINKLGFAEIRFINDSKNRQINSQKFTFGKLDGKDFNKILYEFKINLLTLMSEQDARLLIKSVMNLDNSEDSQKTINSIITNLGNNLNLKHDENKSYFLSNVDNITIDLIGSDLEKINSNLIFEYVYNFVDTPSPKKDENKSSSSKENVKELPTDNDYVLKYKQKIGINELQEIYIFDTKDNKLSNINVLIDSNNFSWYLASDFNGLVIFDPNFSGIYNISLPYPNIKIKAEFEVIDNYISLNDEFVEITSQSSYSVMKNKIFNIFIFVAIIIILIVGIILYFVFKPRKISSIYDFSKSNYYNDYNLRTEIKKEQLEKDIKFAYNEEKILEKKLKDKIGYDL